MPDPSVLIARINARQVIIVTLITGVSGVLGALVQNKIIDARRHEPAASAHDTIGVTLTVASRERDLLYTLLADAVETDLRRELRSTATVTPAHRRRAGEARYAALRRALFLNIGRMGGDERVAAHTLGVLVARWHLWLSPERSRVMAEWGEIRATRLAWLQEVAIPSVRRRNDGSGRQVRVALPSEMQGVGGAGEAVERFAVEDLAAMRREVEMLALVGDAESALR